MKAIRAVFASCLSIADVSAQFRATQVASSSAAADLGRPQVHVEVDPTAVGLQRCAFVPVHQVLRHIGDGIQIAILPRRRGFGATPILASQVGRLVSRCTRRAAE